MFPTPLPLDRSVVRSRLQRRKELLGSAKKSVLLRITVILIELGGFALFGSFSLFLDALASSVDFLFSLALLWCIWLADRPPDRDHPLGHGRLEPVTGLILGVACVFLGAMALFVEGKALFFSHFAKKLEPMTWIIPVITLALYEMGHQMSTRAAKRKSSSALLADAAHYRMDALTSLFALVALALAALFPTKASFFDHTGAVVISISMVVTGLFVARKNIDQLLDRVPSPELFEKIRKAALGVPGILATEKLRVQVYGPDAFVAIDIEVDPYLTVASSHRLTQKVRRAIQVDLPSVRDVIVHVEPYFPGDHEV